jgi:cytochrome c oxidase subunit 2
MLLAVLRKRARPSERPQSQPILFVILAGAVLPVVVLAIVLVFTLDTLKASAKPGDDSSLVVEVTGHRWWWEVHYPDSGVTTANEIHIPVNETVKVELRSADVIHSFWVPQLQGKMDLIPGRDNTLWLEASQEGTYRGQCAEFCGLQHANMAFHVVAQSRADFDAWLATETKPAERPTDPMAVEGQQVFFGSACVYCHTVRGTSASGNLGPDLTHLASREYIAAGTLENVPGNLAGWILDPQSAKPGTLMPPTQMDGPSLQALLYYLESLR